MTKKPIRRRVRTKRVQQYREARAIIAVAAFASWKGPSGFAEAPNYYKIADKLGLPKKSADVADEIWNATNGPDEGSRPKRTHSSASPPSSSWSSTRDLGGVTPQ